MFWLGLLIGTALGSLLGIIFLAILVMSNDDKGEDKNENAKNANNI